MHNRRIVQRNFDLDPGDNYLPPPSSAFTPGPRTSSFARPTDPARATPPAPPPEPLWKSYDPRPEAINELRDHEMPGEARLTEIEDGDVKPMRLIRNIVVYNPADADRMVPFEKLETGESRGLVIIEGVISALPRTDEDFEFATGGDQETEGVCVRLRDVQAVSMDVETYDEYELPVSSQRTLLTYCSPVCIETKIATYIVLGAHDAYLPIYERFYIPRRCTQAMLSIVRRNKSVSFPNFVELFKGVYDRVLARRLHPSWMAHELTVRPFVYH
jgi:hypothetical protein